jgi:hypothetical protein
VIRGNPYVPRNASTADGMPDSVPPTKTYEVEATVSPELDPACQYLELSIINVSADNGKATVSPTRITQTTKVTVTGVDQTKPGHGGQLKIQAKLDGATVKAESAGFTVCAHPINFRDSFHSDISTAGGVGMRVQDDWDSDSGTFSDLDETEISEVVQMGAVTSPPFAPAAASPLQTSSYLAGNSRTVDSHQEPRPAAGPAATLVQDQLSLFKCKRCGVTDKVMPKSGLRITHEVFKDGAQWKHRTRKVGAAVTIGANSTQAAATTPAVGIVSPNHNLP